MVLSKRLPGHEGSSFNSTIGLNRAPGCPMTSGNLQEMHLLKGTKGLENHFGKMVRNPEVLGDHTACPSPSPGRAIGAKNAAAPYGQEPCWGIC